MYDLPYDLHSMLNHTHPQGDFPDSFSYRTKAMFAFEEIDGVEVCFFGMHVQEYGSESQAPNTRSVQDALVIV